MDIINLLPEHIANQIAAGEVIQRPASVVKETLENSIDSGANEIQLIIRDAGKTLIQIIDNGCGMSNNDVEKCFLRHATSKIKKTNDLFAIQTMGFRGEAMASIASISHVELETKLHDKELGTKIIVEGGNIKRKTEHNCKDGTSIKIKNIFFNIPARRKFLKSNNVEMRHIIEEFSRIALSNPNCKMQLIHNEKELFYLEENNFRQRIVSVIGLKNNEYLVPISENTDLVKIDGFICKPEYAKKSRGEQYIFVNKRYIKNYQIQSSISRAFEGLISEKYYPSYFINLKIDPERIDINIHPTKTEIKFDDEQNLFAILKATIKHSLGIFQVLPSIDFEKDPGLDVPYEYIRKSPKEPPIEVNSAFNPFREEKSIEKMSSSSWENLYSNVESRDSANMTSEELKLNLSESPKVFQLFRKYIITSLRSGLLIINQQRAHQRILYEKFLKTITNNDKVSQKLIFPKKIKLSQKEKVLYNEYSKNLKAIGFVTKLSGSNLEIKSAPSIFNHDDLEDIILNLFSMIDDGNFDSFSKSDLLSKSLSKAASIKSGRVLSVTEQQILVDDLFACKEFLTSPFNHQIFVTLSKEELDEKLY